MKEILNGGTERVLTVAQRGVAVADLGRTTTFEALAKVQVGASTASELASSDDYLATITRTGDGQTNVDD